MYIPVQHKNPQQLQKQQQQQSKAGPSSKITCTQIWSGSLEWLKYQSQVKRQVSCYVTANLDCELEL